MKASLRPCPFCGGEAVVMHMGYGEGYLPEVQTVWGVFCRSDLNDEYGHGHCIENYATEEEAIAAWNGMAIESDVAKLIHDLYDCYFHEDADPCEEYYKDKVEALGIDISDVDWWPE